MQQDYQSFFGAFFPFLNTKKPLDFNRCITYRNTNPKFNGYSLLRKNIPDDGANNERRAPLTLLTTPGCFGVGVKFGPLLGELAADSLLNLERAEEIAAARVLDDGVDASAEENAALNKGGLSKKEETEEEENLKKLAQDVY